MAEIRRFVNQPALSRESRPWAREVEDRIRELERSAMRSDGSGLNANKAQNSSIDLVSRNIVDLQARVQTAISSITIDSGQVVSGLLSPARIPVIDQANIVNTWTKSVYNPGGTVDVGTAGGVIGNIYAQNVTTNITAARVSNWARTSDGFVATATSSQRKKTDIHPVAWPIEKLEAIMSMSLVYYKWIAAVELAKYIATLPEDHPRYGEVVPVHQEIGFIAERMHEAGLWEFVVYHRHHDDTLILKNGKPMPFSIHYTNWSLALHAVVQHVWEARKADRADLDLVMATLGLTSTANEKD